MSEKESIGISVLCLSDLKPHGEDGNFMKLVDARGRPDLEKTAFLFECSCKNKVIISLKVHIAFSQEGIVVGVFSSGDKARAVSETVMEYEVK